MQVFVHYLSKTIQMKSTDDPVSLTQVIIIIIIIIQIMIEYVITG